MLVKIPTVWIYGIDFQKKLCYSTFCVKKTEEKGEIKDMIKKHKYLYKIEYLNAKEGQAKYYIGSRTSNWLYHKITFTPSGNSPAYLT